MSHRPTVYGTRHAVSAGHYLAAAAAFSILEAGGNAIDAGCAAGIALGVLQPDLVNVAGVAPIMIRLANGPGREYRRSRLVAEEACPPTSSSASTAATPDGVLRTVVPAAPDAWITALRRHGTMRFADVAWYAIRYAGEGYAVYPLLAISIAAHEHEYRRWRSNTAIFLPGGRVPKSARGWCSPIWRAPCSSWPTRTAPPVATARPGCATAHDAFYRGDIAREIVRFQQREGGYLSMDDLAGVSLADRAGGAPTLARPRGDHLRPVVPGAGAA